MRGELSVSCAYPTFLCRGGASCADPDPIKPFKINRVPVKSQTCSGLASRTKKPSAKAGRFGLARVAPTMMVASCLTRRQCGPATNQSHHQLFQTIRLNLRCRA